MVSPRSRSGRLRRWKVDVGVVLPVEQVIPELGPIQPYARVRALALKAEELGFHSVWTGDHLLFRRFEMTPAI